jgi:hypothetical protein
MKSSLWGKARNTAEKLSDNPGLAALVFVEADMVGSRESVDPKVRSTPPTVDPVERENIVAKVSVKWIVLR